MEGTGIMNNIMDNKIVKILILGRIQFLAAGFLLFVFGALFALAVGAHFSIARFLFGYLIFFCAHLSVHYSNDHFDVHVDSLQKKTLFTGGSGVLVDNPDLIKTSRNIALVLIALSLIFCVVGILAFGFPIWLFGLVVLGNLLGWFYTAPPVKMVYRGFGEISTAFTFGILAPMMGFIIVSGGLSSRVLVMLFPMLSFGFASVLAVQVPDIEGDRMANKLTLVSRIGRKKAFYLIGALLILPTLYYLVFAFISRVDTVVDFSVLFFFSLITLIVGLTVIYAHPTRKSRATMLVNLTLISYILFFMLTNAYLIATV